MKTFLLLEKYLLWRYQKHDKVDRKYHRKREMNIRLCTKYFDYMVTRFLHFNRCTWATERSLLLSASMKPPVHHSYIVPGGLRRSSIGQPLCRGKHKKSSHSSPTDWKNITTRRTALKRKTICSLGKKIN